jgi:aspartate 1-decarboxylase
MYKEMLLAKIHRLIVTDANTQYEGSITIDEKLLQAAGIAEFQKVQIADVTNGARFETYVMKGKPGSGIVCVNGAAARLVAIGDIVIVMAYGLIEENKLIDFKPTIVFVDEKNRIIQK